MADLDHTVRTESPIQDKLDQLDTTVETNYALGPLPYLVVLAGDSVGKVVRLKPGQTMSLGRMRECDLCFDCDNLSRRHASLKIEDSGHATLTDLNSTNGTLVNGKQIESRQLADGDRICMGDVILRYSFQDALEYEFQQDLYNKATLDPLTGAFNKRHFMELFEKEFAFHKRQKLPLSLIMLDLDDFKQLNDTYGHVNGDVVLKSLSGEVLSCMRREDIFARFGGEEFVSLFRCTPRHVAITIANKLVELVGSMKFSTATIEFSTSATAGLVTLEENNFNSPEDMLMAADRNLYLGKNQGKNIVIG